MTTITKPICFDCKHFNIEKLDCAAFPNQQIPIKILYGDNNHLKPLKGQKNKLVFEPKTANEIR